MRFLTVAIVLMLPGLSIANSQPELYGNAEPTLRMFDFLVADYCVSHHAWPSSVEQLRAHILSKRQIPVIAREAVEYSLSFFTKVEFTPRGKGLLLSMRFHSGGSVFEYKKLFYPGRSVEEIAGTRIR